MYGYLIFEVKICYNFVFKRFYYFIKYLGISFSNNIFLGLDVISILIFKYKGKMYN